MKFNYTDIKPPSLEEAREILKKHIKRQETVRLTGVEPYEAFRKALAEMMAKAIVRVVFRPVPRFYPKRRARSMRGK